MEFYLSTLRAWLMLFAKLRDGAKITNKIRMILI